MDWVTGPIADMEPGPDHKGAQLVYELMTHITQPHYTYTHDWDRGDLIIYDNRNLLHAEVTGEHVGRAVVFFASEQTPTTGATLPVDGGVATAFPR